METKICTKCGNEYPATLSFFRKQKNGKYGINCTCKTCLKIYRKAYCSTDKTKKAHAEKMKMWRLKNPEKQRAIVKRNYEKHSLRFNAEKKERYKNDTDYRNKKIEQEKRYKESGRRYEVSSTPEQREKSRAKNKRYRLENKKEMNKKSREYFLKNPEARKNAIKRRHDTLPDSYILIQLKRRTNFELDINDIPKEVLDVKRNMILLKREIGIKGNQKF